MEERPWNGMNWVRQSTRLAIYLRDGLACVYCSAAVESEGTRLTLDHLRPHVRGGDNDPKNLVTACKRCNDSRGKRPLATFARATAAYLDRGAAADAILAHVAACRRRALPRAEARRLLEQRGSVAQVLAEEQRGRRAAVYLS